MTTTRTGVPEITSRPLTGRWRVYYTPAQSGAANMAMDHALLERARRTGEKVLRVYTWSEPTLSLGRHQAARGRIDADVARALGVALVRRPTGGRALLHHREVTYSVTSALAREDSVREWYATINEILLGAVRALGVHAAPAVVSGRTPLPGTASCFVRADEGEIAVDGRKLIGSALLRQDGALLQHGSILLDDDQAMLQRLLPAGEAPPSPAGTLRDSLGQAPSVTTVAAALVASLQGMGAEGVTELDHEPHLLAAAAEVERIYGSEEWTYRY